MKKGKGLTDAEYNSLMKDRTIIMRMNEQTKKFDETYVSHHRGVCELHTSKDGQFYFILKGGNGKVIAQSETYTTKKSAKKTYKRYFLLFTFKDMTK